MGGRISNVAMVSLTINPVNDPPVVEDQDAFTQINTAKDIYLMGFDGDGEMLDFTVGEKPQHGTFSKSENKVTYTPNPKFAGEDRFTFTASDKKLISNIGTISIFVNGPPTVKAGPDQTIRFSDRVTLRGSVSDSTLIPLKNDLEYFWMRVSGPGTFKIDTPESLETQATFDSVGEHILELRASDGELTHSDFVTLTVESLPFANAASQFKNVFKPGEPLVIPCQNTIHIFNRKGEIIKTMNCEGGASVSSYFSPHSQTQFTSWDGKNDQGFVASGVYIIKERGQPTRKAVFVK